MTGKVLSYVVGSVIERMRFPHQGDGGGATSDRVLTAFRRGALLGFHGGTMDGCRRESLTIPWHTRAFFNEGHAMGCAGRTACSFRKNNPESNAPLDYEIMRYVGYGFWNGVAARFPVPRIETGGSLWNGSTHFPKYRLLMANGFGFALVLFQGEFTKKIREMIVLEQDPRKREAILHGVGRVLWFLYLHNYSALKIVLDENESTAEPLAIGLGLAIAFTQVATPDNILRSLDAFPEESRMHLIRGAGIALQVHAQNDPECRRMVEELIHGEMCDWYEGAWQASIDAGEGEEWYPKYHELTRRFAVGDLKVVS